jgi:hypothetical protein
MTSLHPPDPSAPRHALPELRSRQVNILNVPWGKSRSWPVRGGRVKWRYASGFSSPAALPEGHFQHPDMNRF